MDFPEFSMKNGRSLHMYEPSTATFYNTLQNEDKQKQGGMVYYNKLSFAMNVEALTIVKTLYWTFRSKR